MTSSDIKIIIESGNLPGGPATIELKETHISWVLLTEDFAYKIKKPLKFSFLDFSTLEKRRFYCNRELKLNRRLAPDVYLEVLPIMKIGNKHFIGSEEGELVDFCLKMIRIDNKSEMDILLRQEKVTTAQIQNLAIKIAKFHQRVKVIKTAFNPESLEEDFSDIKSVQSEIAGICGLKSVATIKSALELAGNFIRRMTPRLEWRQQNGYVRDCHGDLHSGNIFLLDDPIIFDCIEFGDRYRHIDVLNEVAFLCMDLEYFGRPDLSKSFMEKYQMEFPAISSPEDEELFLFYKWYRAGIRLKVMCLQLRSRMSYQRIKMLTTTIKRYFQLFEHYTSHFEEIKVLKY